MEQFTTRGPVSWSSDCALYGEDGVTATLSEERMYCLCLNWVSVAPVIKLKSRLTCYLISLNYTFHRLHDASHVQTAKPCQEPSQAGSSTLILLVTLMLNPLPDLMKHEICSNRRACLLLQTQHVFSASPLPLRFSLPTSRSFQTCGSVSRAPEGRGRAAYRSTLSVWGKGMWVTAIQRLSANRRFVTCNPETCDLPEENKGCLRVWSHEGRVCVCLCVCDYLTTEDNVSGLVGLIHARTIYKYCLGFLCSCAL